MIEDEEAKHARIHANDARLDERAKVHRLLDDLREVLEKAKIANSRTPAKTSVVEYQLDDALDIIRRLYD